LHKIGTKKNLQHFSSGIGLVCWWGEECELAARATHREFRNVTTGRVVDDLM